MSEEGKVGHLCKMLLADDPVNTDAAALSVDIQAALRLATAHVAAPLPAGSKAPAHAPAVLLAALAVSAASELSRVSGRQ